MSNAKLFLSSRKARVIGLLRPLKDVTVTAGETATFDCELSYEDIPVEWYLKGKKLEPSDKVKSGHTAALWCPSPHPLSATVLFSPKLFHLCLHSPYFRAFSIPPAHLLLSAPTSALITSEIVRQICNI